MAQSFTAAGPAVEDGARLWLDVAIGFEHTVDDDGRVTLARDAEGEYIPRTYRLPMVVTAKDAMEATARAVSALRAHGETLESVSEGKYNVEAHEDVMLALLAAMIGDRTIVTIATDPTVDPSDFESLCQALLTSWGFDTLLEDLFGESEGDAPDPKA